MRAQWIVGLFAACVVIAGCSAPAADDAGGGVDVGADGGRDAGPPGDGGRDGGPDAGHDTGPTVDMGVDAFVEADAGSDGGTDAGSDAGSDGGTDAGNDAGNDAGHDAGNDAGNDAGHDGGTDAGHDASTGCSGVTLTVYNYLAWCGVAINGAASSTAGMQTACVPANTAVSMVQTPASSAFILGLWHHTTGDTGAGDMGAVSGGSSGMSTASVMTGAAGSSSCVWVCCPFTNGAGCAGVPEQCP